jgi:Kef-type K+ transport system membrane component KefB
LNWRESASVGVLMNTRGLVELIVLNIGLEVRTEGGREGGRNGLQCAAAS